MITVYEMASGQLLHQDQGPAKSAPQRAEKGLDDASKARAMEQQLQWPHPELRLLSVAEAERR